ncbi:hypothetical protein [Paenibacillus flagellatus]|uniref:Uncharacterized protein n=1 Tax=Paenibacillus flagellatus TaxID=2211139 RepID=A0A2V5KCM6_9BACL|nr:hypothetical protein [Paenibacillus flagellatus]PYI57361.1 hypothetical protein DLM86_02680 [Paenibacillus flagellatus]
MSSEKRRSVRAYYDPDADRELDELLRRSEDALDEYDVEYPDEADMMRTIDALRPYVPAKESLRQSAASSPLSSLWKRALHEMAYMSAAFWVPNALLFLIGLAAVFAAELNPYAVMLLLAPIPTVSGLWEVWKSGYKGMAELEMSFKYSLQEIVLAKMIGIGAFNLAMNIVLTCGFTFIVPGVWLWKLILYWITPFAVIAAVSFTAASRFRRGYAVTAGLSAWVATGGLLGQTRFVERLESVPPAVYAAIALLAAIVLAVQINRMYKGGVAYEVDYR